MQAELGRSRALLLDRDGVINIDHGYVGTVERFEFQSGIFELTRHAQDLGYRIVVITNQSGIARGYYTEADFLRLTGWMSLEFRKHGVTLTKVFHCPYHLTSRGGPYARDSFWRKPNPGMILEAAATCGLDLRRSIFLGDQPSDMVAARAAGVGRRVFLRHDPVSASAALHPDADLVIASLEALTCRLGCLAAVSAGVPG